ncbi:MAG TPA: PKD domain-containing protein [Solirubrobacterales bacterium]
MSLTAGALTSSADAATSGQIGEAWGSPGGSTGQFFDPAMLGVDPSDGSVYAGDVTPDNQHYRIQKFSGNGQFEALVEIPRIVEGKIVTLHGIAVDPVLHRIYVIEGCHLAKPAGSCTSFGSTYGARRVLAFSTERQGTELVPAEGAATLPLPGGEETLYTPQAIAVDPSDHDLVILAEDISGHTTVQRISSAGVTGARFVDTGNVLRSVGEEATSLAVGPTGATYALTGGPNAAGAEHTRAWELPPALSSLTKVPGFAEAAESEGWTAGLLSPKSSPLLGGPQIAISPDGDTLYWKESLRQSTPTEAGEVLVRGYSLTEGATKALYGGGKGRCAITTSSAGIATTAGDLIVFDYGAEGETPLYGGKVLTFGPGGSGCPAAVAKFSVNGREEESVSVGKGATVTFDASRSELLEGFRRELIWKFGDGSEKVVKFTPETGTEPAEEAEVTVTHQYASAGDFTVRLEIKLSEAPFGNPPPAERTLKVEGPSEPKFKLTVSETGAGTVTSSPSGIACGSDCEAEYERGTVVTLIPTAGPGSEFKGWSGACAGTGACEVTISAAKSVSAKFAPALKPKFKLTVSETGLGAGTVTSSPSGIACGPACEAEYEEGTSVALVANPGAEAEFKGWSGACTGTGACEVTMSQVRSVGAEFAPAPKLRVMLTVLKTGSGIVTSSPGGIACGAICERGYEKGDLVKLNPIPALASKFEGWSGACAGIGACEVTMSAAREVTATFDTVFAVPSIASPPAGGGNSTSASTVPASAPPPSPRPEHKVSPLAKCKKLKGRKKAKCIKHARKGRR